MLFRKKLYSTQLGIRVNEKWNTNILNKQGQYIKHYIVNLQKIRYHTETLYNLVSKEVFKYVLLEFCIFIFFIIISFKIET